MSPPTTSHPPIALEVCIDSLESARNALHNGADRLEVCSTVGIAGGGTPSVGLVKLIQREFPNAIMHVMVRPRLGHFVYTADEIATMKEDIGVFKSMGVGVAGVVFGVLTNEGRVNVHQAKELAEAAAPLQVTFHRAFDVTRDLDEAFDDIARVPGITRILTSGGAIKAPAALPIIARLIKRAHEASATREARLSILPGSGLSSEATPSFLDGVASILSQAGGDASVIEIHSSCGIWSWAERTDLNEQQKLELDDKVWEREGPFALGFGEFGPAETRIFTTTGPEVAALRKVLDSKPFLSRM